VALEGAQRLRLRRRTVLPFLPERFRKTSVTDRPGDWAGAFDRLIAAAEATGDLVVLPVAPAGRCYPATRRDTPRRLQGAHLQIDRLASQGALFASSAAIEQISSATRACAGGCRRNGSFRSTSQEACCGAHHLGRVLAQGHGARLMSPEYVRPYVKSQKKDDIAMRKRSPRRQRDRRCGLSS
jgi:hypothetical protein